MSNAYAQRGVVVLTGAGISAESGLGTFRDVDGIWTKYPLEDLATPEGFARNPICMSKPAARMSCTCMASY